MLFRSVQLAQHREDLAKVKQPSIALSNELREQWKDRRAWETDHTQRLAEVARLRTEKASSACQVACAPEPEKYEGMIRDREAERLAISAMYQTMTERKKRMDEAERKIAAESGGFSPEELAQPLVNRMVNVVATVMIVLGNKVMASSSPHGSFVGT